MKLSYFRHLGSQWPVIRSLGQAAFSGSKARKGAEDPAIPGPWHEATLPPRSKQLCEDVVAWSGGDPSWYREQVPAYLFPQWSFPLITEAMKALPYPLTRILNAGCLLRVEAPLPAGQTIHCRARLSGIEETPKGKRFTVQVETGTQDVPRALYAELHTYLPYPKKKKSEDAPKEETPKKEQPRVPTDAKELRFLDIKGDAGREFALLTGDINPIHWSSLYAKMSGFKRCILHGFGSFALTCEAIHRNILAGQPNGLQEIEVRFRKPLVLPARAGIYTHDTQGLHEIFVGDAPGGSVYLQGHYTLKAPSAGEKR